MRWYALIEAWLDIDAMPCNAIHVDMINWPCVKCIIMVNIYIKRRTGSLMLRSVITFMLQNTRGGGAASVAQRDVAFLFAQDLIILRCWQPRQFLYRESKWPITSPE